MSCVQARLTGRWAHQRPLSWTTLAAVVAALAAGNLAACEDVDPNDPSTINNPRGRSKTPDAGPQKPVDPCGGDPICRLDDDPDSAGDRAPFSTGRDFLTVHTGSSYRPIFLKGINLGVAVPGTRAGHLAATRQQYASWFDQMTDMGVNVVRIYTLHDPRFYQELAKHNAERPDHPLYVLHGIWLREDFEGLDLLTDGFRANIREAVDCTHGNCHINHRFGKAYGTYDADISEWIIGWIVGREVNPSEVELTNEHMRGQTSWTDGAHIRVTDAQPTEVWWGQQVDYLIDYELDGYGQTRPISVSSWPTLDPLDHPTESADFSSEDINSFDMLALEAIDAPGGLFATYHAYPYYPDFIVDQAGYRNHSDEDGKNSYLGYLTDLKSHYKDMPLFIGETGVPSSWGSAHWGYKHMNHGGHTEVEQGEVGGRLFRTVYDTTCAGAALFAWIDEWWKPTWITDPRGSSADRRAFWHNVTAPEQNFGLIGFDLGEPPWEDDAQTTSGHGFVGQVSLIHDVEYFYVRLETTGRLAPDDEIVVGFDTYGSADSGQFDQELGESELPNGVSTENRNEFALIIDSADTADLKVTRAYDSRRIWYGARFAAGQVFHSTQSDGDPWNLVVWLNGQAHGIKDDPDRWFEETTDEIGHLSVRRKDEPATNLDAVVVGPDRIDIRIPWTLLNVTDPSKRQVLHASPNAIRKGSPQHALTRGIAVSVTYNGDLLVETDRYSWPTWGNDSTIDIPGYVPDEEGVRDWQKYERIKPALGIFSDALQQLPTWMN